MADPVMSDLPLRRVLECVTREYQTRSQIIKAHSLRYPMEGWIRFSDRMRRSLFKEEREEVIDVQLLTLLRRGYIRLPQEEERNRIKFPSYRLTDLGTSALASVKKR